MGKREQRHVIAVVTDAFAPFHRKVLDGLWPQFSAAGYGTLAVAGRDVRTDRLIGAAVTDHGRYHGVFGTQLEVRGAVVVCGATPPEMSDSAVVEYVAELAQGPVVSLGIVLPGVPSVTIAWDDAIDELMAHMVRDPRRRRFVFIRGFAGDPHSKRREAGFRAGMAKAGLHVDEDLVVSGNYSVADALASVARLLDHGQRFDGIIAANDDMAVGALAALNGHGLRVPEDVIVAGFDDSLAAFTSEPALTSVRLDTSLLTQSTARLLLDSIESDRPIPPDLEIQIESGLAVRASTRLPIVDRRPPVREPSGDLAAHLFDRITSRWEVDRAPKRIDIDDLAQGAVDTMLTGDDSFLRARNRSYTNPAPFADPAEVFWLRHAARELQALTVELGEGQIPEAGLRAMVKELAAVERRLRPTEALQKTEGRAHLQLQERLLMRLATCSDIESLWVALRTGLRSLGMSNAWVATNDESPSEAMMQLLFSLDEELGSSPELFPRASVLPERFGEVLERDVHVLVPLRAGNSDIGYMVVEPRGEHLLELEAIASAIAQVLRHVHQVGDLKHQAARLRLANEALDRLARLDSLTGLANRKLFLERLDQQLETVGPDRELSILFLDLDGFKLINDTLGHEAGDHLLQLVADRLAGVLDEVDTLARLGGDEFTILVGHGTGDHRAVEIAEAALAALERPCVLLGRTFNISASIGIARSPDDGTSTDELVRNADAAMYAAKAAGKNRFTHYEDVAVMPRATVSAPALDPVEP